MAKNRQINWKTFKKRWQQYPEIRYLMVQAIRTRMVDYLYAINITKAEELHEYFLNLINNEYPIQILAVCYKVQFNYLKLLMKHYSQENGFSEGKIMLPFFNFGNGHANIYEKYSFILYQKIINEVSRLNEIQKKLLDLNHHNLSSDHALTLNVVLGQALEINISNETVVKLYEICNYYLKWIRDKNIEKTADQNDLLELMEGSYKPAKEAEAYLTEKLYQLIINHLPNINPKATIDELLEIILSIDDEQLRSELLYHGLRTKYMAVHNRTQRIGNRWHEYLAYLVDATNLTYFSDVEKGLLHYFYAYSIYERLMNNSMSNVKNNPLYQKHLDVLQKATELLLSSEISDETDFIVRNIALLFTFEQANLEANLYQTGHPIVKYKDLYLNKLPEATGTNKRQVDNKEFEKILENFLKELNEPN